jgi:hypothetical protein
MDEYSSESHSRVSSLSLSRAEILFLLFLSAFVFLQIFILPFKPVFVEGDQMIPVSNAMRILDGEVVYRDFFHFIAPGADLWYALLFSIFGTKIWILNATIFILALAQIILVFAFSKRLLCGAYRYLPALIYFVLGFRLFGIDGSHRLFSVVLVLASALAVMYGLNRKALVLVGALCGLSSFFSQSRGVLGVGAIGLFILWNHWVDRKGMKRIFVDWTIASISFIAVLFVTQFYMAWLAGFENYYFDNVTFLKDYYGNDTLSNTFAYFTDIPNLDGYIGAYGTAGGLFRFFRVTTPTLFFYAIVPMAYLAFFIFRKLRTIVPKADRDLMLLSILGVVLYAGASAPTAARLYHISIPALVVLIWMLSRAPSLRIPAKVCAILLVILGVMYCIQRQTVTRAEIDLPAGNAVFLSPPTAEKFVWLMSQTEPGDYLWEAQHPTYYFPLLLKNPTPFFLVRDNNFTPAFQVEQLMRSLGERPPRLIAWHGLWSKEPGERKLGDNLAPLWEFIRSNYHLKKEFREMGEFTVNGERDIEFWELNRPPVPAAIDQIN